MEKVGYHGSFAQFNRLYITGYHGFCREDCLIMPTWNHLWFAACFMAYEVIRRVRLLQPLFGVGREANVPVDTRVAAESRAPAGSF